MYTDGAAVHVGHLGLAVAGSAAIQIRGDDVFVVCMRLDLGLPQNAACAEYVAVILAAEHIRPGQVVQVVSDSAVVIRSFVDTHFEGNHKLMYSGTWRSFSIIGKESVSSLRLKVTWSEMLRLSLVSWKTGPGTEKLTYGLVKLWSFRRQSWTTWSASRTLGLR